MCFFGDPDGPSKLRWPRSKIKGTYVSDWGLAQMAKNRVEPRKMTHKYPFYLILKKLECTAEEREYIRCPPLNIHLYSWHTYKEKIIDNSTLPQVFWTETVSLEPYIFK